MKFCMELGENSECRTSLPLEPSQPSTLQSHFQHLNQQDTAFTAPAGPSRYPETQRALVFQERAGKVQLTRTAAEPVPRTQRTGDREAFARQLESQARTTWGLQNS